MSLPTVSSGWSGSALSGDAVATESSPAGHRYLHLTQLPSEFVLCRCPSSLQSTHALQSTCASTIAVSTFLSTSERVGWTCYCRSGACTYEKAQQVQVHTYVHPRLMHYMYAPKRTSTCTSTRPSSIASAAYRGDPSTRQRFVTGMLILMRCPSCRS